MSISARLSTNTASRFHLEFSRLCIITSHTNLFPGYSFSTDKQHEGTLKGSGKVTGLKFENRTLTAQSRSRSLIKGMLKNNKRSNRNQIHLPREVNSLYFLARETKGRFAVESGTFENKRLGF